MKDFINSLNNEALERLIPIISNTLFDTEFIWTFSQTFYAEDGTSVELCRISSYYRIIFDTEKTSRMSFSISKAEYLAIRCILERNTNKVYNYCK